MDLFLSHGAHVFDVPPKLSSLCDLSALCLQIVLENSSREDKHECPFGRSSIELTKMLCETLKVGELRKYPRFPRGRGTGQQLLLGLCLTQPALAAPKVLSVAPRHHSGRAFIGPGLQCVYFCSGKRCY